ncbi:SusD family protein [Paenimyroides ummariense]|uniref:SusD family protein n=1 Tax=Paenimyroides ummariense TaxID=913024 RepID=A0A1I5FNQ1_9FLAO|nr:RagB/SusD family nutrient uptake outer membrane protein [Paenimyroides ummariense]SFO25219.1 SusD family protein [Paenimyroides ummariense]
MKTSFENITVLLFTLFILNSCEEFLDVEVPKNEIDQELVFSDDRMALSALTNTYSKIRDQGFFAGNKVGIGYLLGCYTDELEVTNPQESSYLRFYKNSVLSDNTAVISLWSNTYNQIYLVNNVLEGIEKSKTISPEVQDQLKGEALALRAILNFYLTQTFGDIPYILSTDYRVNTKIGKQSVNEVVVQAVEDLLVAEQLVSPAYPSSEKVRINRSVVEGFLARMYLYQNNWDKAQYYAEKLINSGTYMLEPIGTTFLKESKSAIWQLKPEAEGRNTIEAGEYQFESTPSPFARLSTKLLGDFEQGDLRKQFWVRFVGDDKVDACAFKYKQKGISSPSREYSIIMRIEEMYLIAAEAAAHKGSWQDFNRYVNAIRERAGLALLDIDNHTDALNAVKKERRVELFCEYGHRFYDLKRWKNFDELFDVKPQWQQHYQVLPLPEKELLLNPNLLPQNTGY